MGPLSHPLRFLLAALLRAPGLLLAVIMVQAVIAQPPRVTVNPIVERVGDTAFIQLQAESLRQLDARQQALAYWLTQASIAIDPIVYDQLSQYGVREKRLLEEIVSHPLGIAPDVFANIRRYALLLWANRGNHNENTSQKFLPAFTFDELQRAALTAQGNGAFTDPYADLPALATEAGLTRELAALRASLFDPAFEPVITAKTPPAGQDIIQASSNTFYRGVTLAELATFRAQHPLNSRVVKNADGTLSELSLQWYDGVDVTKVT